MNISRRSFLKLSALLAAGTASGCSPLASYLPGEDPPPGSLAVLSASDWGALNRLTYGPTPLEVNRVQEIGLPAWMEEQLKPAAIPDRKADLLLGRIDILDLDADALRARGDQLFDNYDPDVILDDFRRAALLRKVYSRRQLYEHMVEFWTDHFHISVQKGDCWYLKVVDDREVIRPHALGNFRELLAASSRSAAMLVYLDNQANHHQAPNENYARELLELHTLGVDGGYTQDDVMQLARTLTGWTVKEHFWRGRTTFQSNLHHPGTKTILGRTIPASGPAEIDRVLDLLAVHPATARTIAYKMAQRFLADHPAPALVDRAARTFLETGGDIKATLRVILLDGLGFPMPESPGAKYKRPLHFLVSALRQTEAETNGGPDLQAHLKRMGQPLYAWPTPDGYPDTAAAWQGNLLPRWQFAFHLASNQIPGTALEPDPSNPAGKSADPEEALDCLSRRLLGQELPATEKSRLLDMLNNFPGAEKHQFGRLLTAALLASPAFQWR